MSDIGQEVENKEIQSVWKPPVRDLPPLDFDSDMSIDDLIKLEEMKNEN